MSYYDIETYFDQEPHIEDYGGWTLGKQFESFRDCAKWRIVVEDDDDTTETLYMKAFKQQIEGVGDRLGTEYTVRINHKHSGPYWTIKVTQ